MIRRPRRSVPATLVALVLLAGCVLVVLSVIQSLAGQAPLVRLSGLLGVTSGQRWNSAATVATAVVVAVVGLALLVVALRPGAPTVLPLARRAGDDGEPGADAGVRRRTLAKDLSAAAGTVPGVSHASVTAARGMVIATVHVVAGDPSVPDQVRQRLEGRLNEIGPATRPRIRVRTRRTA